MLSDQGGIVTWWVEKKTSPRPVHIRPDPGKKKTLKAIVQIILDYADIF